MFGPASLAAWREQFAPSGDARAVVHPIAEAAVRVAVDELGHGEEHRNNAGESLHRYRDFPYGDEYSRPIGEWCAFFVGYCLEQGAARAGAQLPFTRRFYDDTRNRRMPIGSAKALGRRMADAGAFVRIDDAQRGDVLVWDRGRADSPAGHIGIVEHVAARARIAHTIEGNVGAFPARVARRQWDMDRPGRLEFIARLV